MVLVTLEMTAATDSVFLTSARVPLRDALKMSGLQTKKDAIEEGLKLLVQVKRQKEIKRFRGKLKWSGNLDEMRLDK